jgi:hypothetical protein
MITALILLVALVILGWGLYRAQPMSKLGLLAWFQSVVLMLPWLLFFGLSATGVEMNLASVLFLLVGSTGVYIALGRQIRSILAVSAKQRASQTPPKLPKDLPIAPPSESSVTLETAPVPGGTGNLWHRHVFCHRDDSLSGRRDFSGQLAGGARCQL